jgi:ATP-dependent DNA helicase RecQ
MRDYQDSTSCRMAFLRAQLDDPDLLADDRCGRCDNCAGSRFTADVDERALEAANDRLRQCGVELAPRRIWPTGMARLGVNLSGRVDDGPLEGRAIGRLTDLFWGPRLRRLLDAPDGPIPDELLSAAIAVLADWPWQTRPEAVMGLDSLTHPLLIGSVVDRLGEVGRLTNLGTLRYRSTRRPVTASNSAYRVAALHDAWQEPNATELQQVSGTVLLVDDFADTGWTLTTAARCLRRAGVSGVLPLALAGVS